ncbi:MULTISPECIES: hypothetical protein [Bacillus cereus group]|uniref:hypothetical protein n=1 Tax=Bacillus cereus group TaxID=86661 RepID=UPI000994E997|nr:MULTISPECIES: hypothetical protein [Bacillus cereus group]
MEGGGILDAAKRVPLPAKNGPAGLIITGIILYVANNGDDMIEIYDIANPILPVCGGEFNGGNLNQPIGMAIFSLFG